MSAKILMALNTVMAAVGFVQKTGVNKFHNYKYASEEDLLDAIRPEIVKAGLVLIPSQKSITPIDEYGNIFIEVEYTLAHVSGDIWPEKIKVYGAGNDKSAKGSTGDKGIYKASTGANKYLLLRLLQISTGTDPEADHGSARDAEPAKALPDHLQQFVERPFVERPHGGKISERAAAPRPQVTSGRPSNGAANPFDATEEEKAGYIAKFGSNVKLCSTEDELVEFWKSEDKARAHYQIASDSSHFAQLTHLAAERKAEILNAFDAPF